MEGLEGFFRVGDPSGKGMRPCDAGGGGVINLSTQEKRERKEKKRKRKRRRKKEVGKRKEREKKKEHNINRGFWGNLFTRVSLNVMDVGVILNKKRGEGGENDGGCIGWRTWAVTTSFRVCSRLGL